MEENLGSIELIGVDKQCYTDGKTRYRRTYQGFSEDFDKLPVKDDMAAGSSCRFIDNGTHARYHTGTKSWYLCQSSGGESSEPSDNTATDKEVKDLLDSIFGAEDVTGDTNTLE